MASLRLKELFISKVRVKLLQIFLTNPEDLLYVRQLVRRSKEEINAVRRELSHMEKADMVKKELRGNRLYYWFRKDYPFFPELMSMVAKTTGLGSEIIAKRSKLGRISFVVFSANFAYRRERKPEDIDMLIVGETVLPEINALVQAEQAKQKTEINYTVMTDQEFKFRKSGRDPFLTGILSAPRLMIIGGEDKLLA